MPRLKVTTAALPAAFSLLLITSSASGKVMDARPRAVFIDVQAVTPADFGTMNDER